MRTPDGPFVTMTERGVITFSVPAYDLLGSPEAVKLLYDEAERIVGFWPAKKADWNAYGLRPRARRPDRSLPHLFAASQAFRAPRHSQAYLEDGILCADLKQGARPLSATGLSPGRRPRHADRRPAREAIAAQVDGRIARVHHKPRRL